MKKCNDIDFLNSYWTEAKAIANRVKTELPQIKKSDIGDVNNKMYIVKFSDISGKSWGVQDVVNRLKGSNKNLGILADKISNMIHKGRGNDVKPMLSKIVTGRIKSLSKKPPKNSNDCAEHIGKGHFRWNGTAIVLDQQEINHIKEYFNL